MAKKRKKLLGRQRWGRAFIVGYEHDDKGKPLRDSKGRLVPVYGPLVPLREFEDNVDLEIITQDVETSHARKGEGDSRNCAVSFTIRRQRDKFQPYFTTGLVEFTDTRAYVGIGKLGRQYPNAYLRFEHNAKWLTMLFDTKRYREVLKKLEAAGGTLIVRLHPFRPRDKEKFDRSKLSSEYTGERTYKVVRGPAKRAMRIDDRSIQEIQDAAQQDETHRPDLDRPGRPHSTPPG